MSNKNYTEDYKGQKVMIYGSGNKWRWRVTIFDDSLKSQVKTSNFSSSKSYLTKEEATMSAKGFIDNKIR